MGFGWEFPPGVTGLEPQITGDWPCWNCGRPLPEEADCPECGVMLDDDGEKWVCERCGFEASNYECPEGC